MEGSEVRGRNSVRASRLFVMGPWLFSSMRVRGQLGPVYNLHLILGEWMRWRVMGKIAHGGILKFDESVFLECSFTLKIQSYGRN